MTRCVILGTGPSLTQEAVDYVRGKARVIAVSDSFRLAPWADALVSYDSKWWRANPDAQDFAGLKFSRHHYGAAKEFSPRGMPNGCNSGLMGCFVSRDHFGDEEQILLGFDMHGSHYFGPHTKSYKINEKEFFLKNTTEQRFRDHVRQFSTFAGGRVTNCTPGSALKIFPFADIAAIL